MHRLFGRVMGFSVALSPLDEARFGFRTAKASGIAAADVPKVLAFCRKEKAEFLIARCDTTDNAAAQALEAAGCKRMDTLIYVKHTLGARAKNKAVCKVRPLQPEDTASVIEIAQVSFKDYIGHYHADARLPRAACDDVYVDWTRRSCSKEAADEVLVAVMDDTPAGYLAIKRDKMLSEITLNAVAPEKRGKGIYQAMLNAALDWAETKACREVIVSSQQANAAAQAAWAKTGFQSYYSLYTYHGWFS